MAQGPSPDSKAADLPTIIIDPSLYEPERPMQETLGQGFGRLTRVMLLVTGVGTATIGIAHVLEVDSLSLRSHVLALTTKLSRLRDGNAGNYARVQARSVKPVARPGGEADGSARAQTPAASRVVESSPAPELIAPVAAAVPVLPAPVEAAPESATPEVPGAIEAVSKPVVRRPLDIQAAIQNARRMLATNRFEEAEAAYRKVLAVSDGQPAALVGLARVQLARGQLDEALASAQRAADKAPDQASSHLALGDVLRARGEKAAAQAQYEQATLRNATRVASESATRAE